MSGGERTESQRRWSNIVFGVLFLVSILAFGRIMLPFVMPVLLSGFLVVLLQPVHQRLCVRLGRRGALAAGIMTLGVLAGIVVPLAITAYFVGREVLVVLEWARRVADDAAARDAFLAKVPSVFRGVTSSVLDTPRSDEAILAAVTSSATVVKDLLGAGTELAIDVFLMSVSMYYFFMDGRRLYTEAAKLLPLERRYTDAFAKEFKDVATAIVYGNTLTAMLQGALGLAGLYLAGVPHPVVWAVAMALVALIPVGGTAIVWLPASVILMTTGRMMEGIFLMSWGALIVSTVDNVVRPKLCGSRMTLHPLLVFLSMFGGLAVFGMMGLLVGPLIAAMFMAMVRIYRRDFLVTAKEAVQELIEPHRREGVQPVPEPRENEGRAAGSTPSGAP